MKLFNFFKKNNSLSSVGLALSGGASRGLTHIGVLRAFEEFGLPIHAICGVSSGSLVGGLYAAGVSISTLIDILPTLNWRSFASFHLSKKGMVSSIKIQQLVESFIGDMTLKQCKIPFSTVVTNLETAKSEVFSNSDHKVSEVIRASCSFPGVFSPMNIDGNYYVDGGIFQHLPVQPLRNSGMKKIIGVDVIPVCKLSKTPKNIPLILDRSLDLMLHHQVNIGPMSPDVLLRPVKVPISSFDIKEYRQLIEYGYQSVKLNRKKIESII